MQTILKTALAVTVAALVACQAGDVTDPSADRNSTGSVTTGGTPAGAAAGAVRVRCEVRSNRSKISVDGRSLRPATATYSARAVSGGNVASAPARAAVGGEVEFDFDSDPGDIAEGAVAIGAGFIVGGSVTGEILDAAGTLVATATVSCTVK
ncbi:MAG: hypothetical protein AB7L66_03265 [Gemmatimonadales bacterium]